MKAANLPKVLRNYNAFINGEGYAGRVNELEPPELKIKTEEHRAGGMDAPIEIDLGMEAMSAKITVGEYSEGLLRLFGKMDGTAVRAQFRGALKRDGEKAQACIIELHGGFKAATFGAWKAGDISTLEVEMSVRYYKLTLGSEKIIEIDTENMIRWIDGVDELASIREAIGM